MKKLLISLGGLFIMAFMVVLFASATVSKKDPVKAGTETQKAVSTPSCSAACSHSAEKKAACDPATCTAKKEGKCDPATCTEKKEGKCDPATCKESKEGKACPYSAEACKSACKNGMK